MFTRVFLNAGSISQTFGEQYNNIGLTSRVCWVSSLRALVYAGQ